MKTGVVSKLAALRQKTDRELLALVNTELKRALILANVAATTESPFYGQAEKIVERMGILLATIPGVDQTERQAFESTAKEVRLALDLLPAQRLRADACSTVAT